MLEAWGRPKPKITNEGPSVPTIPTALENDEDLARLLPELAKIKSEDRLAFMRGLDNAIRNLELDKPLPSDVEDLLKAYGAAAIGMPLGLLIGSFLIGPPGAVAAYVGAAAAGGEAMRQYMTAQKRGRQEMLRRMRLLRRVLGE